MNAIAYFAGRDPAFAIMGDLLAGYTCNIKNIVCRWWKGNASKIYDKILPGKILVLGCGPYGMAYSFKSTN